MNIDKLASIVETLTFLVGEPLDKEDIKKVTGATELELNEACISLRTKYSNQSGILLKEFGNKIQLCTNPENAEFVEELLNPIQRKTLSQSALEVLSIIAYRQPITRGEIEQIRGVKCDYSVMSLKQKGLIREMGHKDVIGRPMLFGTTDLFLRHFGLSSLDDLPMQQDLEILELGGFVEDKSQQMKLPIEQEFIESTEETL